MRKIVKMILARSFIKNLSQQKEKGGDLVHLASFLEKLSLTCHAEDDFVMVPENWTEGQSGKVRLGDVEWSRNNKESFVGRIGAWHHTQFKVRLASGSIRSGRLVAELGEAYGVHLIQTSRWKKTGARRVDRILLGKVREEGNREVKSLWTRSIGRSLKSKQTWLG